MHIPDLEKAISELARVLKKGGTAVISEINMFSLQSIIKLIVLRNLRGLLGGKNSSCKKTAAGLEYWKLTSAGNLLSREANIRWLMGRFKNNGLTVKKRISGQFTELYVKVSPRLLKNLIHGFNNLWFKYVRIPYLAFGNIIILRKQIWRSATFTSFSFTNHHCNVG